MPDNGLPQNGVRQMTQTPDGYLWFTTFDGLVRFDGVRFTTKGRRWFGGFGGLSLFTDGRFTNRVLSSTERSLLLTEHGHP